MEAHAIRPWWRMPTDGLPIEFEEVKPAMSLSSTFQRLGLTFAVVVTLCVSMSAVWWGPIDLDEGYNLSVVTTLVEEGRYATKRLSTTEDFNPAITTGPVVLLPSAAVASLFGVSTVTVRVVPLLYFWAMAWVVTLLAWRLYGRAAAWLTLLMLGVSSYVVGISVVVLGEAAGLLFVLMGFWAIQKAVEGGDRRWWALAFAAHMAAALCKFQYLLAVLPATALTALLLYRRQPRSLWPMTAAYGGLIAGIGLWVGVHLLVLGVPETGERLLQMRQFGATMQPGGANTNVALLGTLMPVPVFVATVAWSLWHLRQTWKHPLTVQLVTFSLGWFVWFLFLDKQPFARHAFPGVVLFFMLFVGACLSAWQAAARSEHRPWRLAVQGGVALALIAMIGSRAYRTWPYLGPTNQAEQAFAAYIRDRLPDGAALYGWSYITPWGIGFLTGRPVDRFPPYEPLALSQAPYLVVSLSEHHWFRDFLALRGQEVFSSKNYHLYRLFPAPLLEPNSLNRPEALRGTITPYDVPTRFTPGGRARLTLDLHNDGSVLWLGPTADGIGQVAVIARWKEAHSQGQHRHAIHVDVPPGGTYRMPLDIDAPPEEGPHDLELRLTSHGVTEFGPPQRINIRLSTSAAAPKSAGK
jgi:hypothetical protein